MTRVTALIVAMFSTTSPLWAATDPLTDTARDEVLAGLVDGMRDVYVLKQKGGRLADELAAIRENPEFQSLTSADDLAQFLTHWLREHGNDLHLVVMAPENGSASGPRIRRRVIAEPATGAEPSGDGLRRRVVVAPAQAGGAPGAFETEMLPGDVGYLRIPHLMGAEDPLDGALNRIADAQALLIDVRGCPGGGSPLNVNLASVLFDERTVLLNLGDRDGNLDPIYTDPDRDVPNFAGKPAYVLADQRTGSACEEVAWDLKYHDKAIVVGERTAGAGLGAEGMTDLGHGFTAMIPTFRPVHPRTDIGFEGRGVQPDVEVGSVVARDTAYLLALTQLAEQADGDARAQLQALHSHKAAELSSRWLALADAARALRVYEGYYGQDRQVELTGGRLFAVGPGARRLPLHPIADDEFIVEGTPGQRMRFVRDGGKIVAMQVSAPGGVDWGNRYLRASSQL